MSLDTSQPKRQVDPLSTQRHHPGADTPPLTEYQSMDPPRVPRQRATSSLSSLSLPSIDEELEIEEAASPPPPPATSESRWAALLTPKNFLALQQQERRASTSDIPKCRPVRRNSLQQFFHTTFLGGKDTTSTEETLLPTTTSNPDQEQKKPRRWSLLRMHVKGGHFLVTHSQSEDEEQSAAGDNQHRERLRSSVASSGSPRRHQKRLLLAYQEIYQRIHFSSKQCLLLILFYIALSVLIFSFLFQKEWTIIDSCYFAVSTFSTNGYGDLAPDTDMERIITCFYALSGVSFVAVALGMLGSNLIDVHEKSVDRAKQMKQYQAMALFQEEQSSTGPDTTMSTDAADETTAIPNLQEVPVAVPNTWCTNKGFWLNFSASLLIGLLGYLIGKDQEWDLLTTIYFGIVTACTVGYGDFVPSSQYSRMLGVLFIPLAAVSMARCIQLVAKRTINRRRYKSIQSFCTTKELSLKDLEVMDRNGDGVVAWSDFLEFMLLAMQRVDERMLEELRSQFDRLDQDSSGTLDKQDLIELAKKELLCPRRKLQLAIYKKSLLQKSEQPTINQHDNRPSSLRNVAGDEDAVLKDIISFP